MDTPICDFVRRYAESGSLRAHMPGHKGTAMLGMEALDITEIDGADSLYEADGIIKESEANAGALFGANTFYCTEGSSQCIRAMLYLAAVYAKRMGKQPRIAAARNVHKTFLSAAALLDIPVTWLYPQNPDSYLSCRLDENALDKTLSEGNVTAVYVTSPDYLGNLADIAAIGEICRRHGCLLLVDNAHGAYLKFLAPSRHPIDLGADICCDSAHKTLPVLTGGAYLHICRSTPALLREQAKNALALFGSTSPSYLILQSLDMANAYLSRDYGGRLGAFVREMEQCKERLKAGGWCLSGDEPLKLTLRTKPYGYTGRELADILLEKQIVCEFSDPDFLVMMLTPETGRQGLEKIEKALLSIPRRSPVTQEPPVFRAGERVLSIREAMLSASRTVPASESLGKIIAAATVGCPPAVPIVVCGERIDENALRCFAYYGIETCTIADESD